MSKFTSETGKAARAKVKNNPNKWTKEQAKQMSKIGVAMRLHYGSSRNQHTKGT